jgi:DNA-binding NarL/FixJ family response regulator
VRVVIAADALLTRAGLAHLLGAASVVAEVADAEALVRKTRGHRPDAVVIDLPAPPLRELRAEHPALGLLVLGGDVDPEVGAAGVGYLPKERIREPGRLLGAVREVARGGSVLDPAVVGRLLDRPLDVLTPREREVLAGMAAGESNRGIARRLFVSESAVERHVTAIFAKLRLGASENVHRRVLAVRAYLRQDVRFT